MIQNKVIKNKKGDISTLILVIGVFLVCAVAIFSFALFKSSSNDRFGSVAYMAHVNSLKEEVKFYENSGLNPEDFLPVKKQADKYNLTFSKITSNNKTFYVQYVFDVGK